MCLVVAEKSPKSIPNNEPFFVALNFLRPAQHRFAAESVAERIQKAQIRGDLVQEGQNYILKFDSGKSLYPLTKAVMAIKFGTSFIICDGHHSILASVNVDAQTFPIRITQDLSHMAEDELWQKLENEGLAYLADIKGERKLPPKSFKDLQEDPLRYFVSLICRKYDEDLKHENSRGCEHPLWIKIGKDIPFIEFILADHLRKYGFICEKSMTQEELIQSALEILIKNPLSNIKLVKDRVPFDKNRDVKYWLDFYQRFLS